jgi:hypothetical protein
MALHVIVALALLSAVFWISVALLGPVGVESSAWCLLYAACTALSVLAVWRRTPRLEPGGWLYLAACSALLAVGFFGANVALDALHGADRPKANVADSLGGLQLWFVLFPGLTSSALACAAAGLVAKCRRPGSHRRRSCVSVTTSRPPRR